MNLFICLDDNNGMMFNNRRQSKDSVVRNKMLSLCEGKNLLVNGYSASQFDESDPITIDEKLLQNATEGDFCFVENLAVDLGRVKRLYIFKWNRRYPHDMSFEGDLSGFDLVSTDEFAGSSHDKITLEIFERI